MALSAMSAFVLFIPFCRSTAMMGESSTSFLRPTSKHATLLRVAQAHSLCCGVLPVAAMFLMEGKQGESTMAAMHSCLVGVFSFVIECRTRREASAASPARSGFRL